MGNTGRAHGNAPSCMCWCSQHMRQSEQAVLCGAVVSECRAFLNKLVLITMQIFKDLHFSEDNLHG